MKYFSAIVIFFIVFLTFINLKFVRGDEDADKIDQEKKGNGIKSLSAELSNRSIEPPIVFPKRLRQLSPLRSPQAPSSLGHQQFVELEPIVDGFDDDFSNGVNNEEKESGHEEERAPMFPSSSPLSPQHPPISDKVMKEMETSMDKLAALQAVAYKLFCFPRLLSTQQKQSQLNEHSFAFHFNALRLLQSIEGAQLKWAIELIHQAKCNGIRPEFIRQLVSDSPELKALDAELKRMHKECIDAHYDFQTLVVDFGYAPEQLVVEEKATAKADDPHQKLSKFESKVRKDYEKKFALETMDLVSNKLFGMFAYYYGNRLFENAHIESKFERVQTMSHTMTYWLGEIRKEVRSQRQMFLLHLIPGINVYFPHIESLGMYMKLGKIKSEI